jgi:cytochrome c oxidase subunit III
MPAEAAALRLQHHFPSLAQQGHAARLGMWLFLSTEILLFTGLFTCYSVYRWLFPEVFAQASAHLDTGIGTANTFVLITSSLTVALGLHAAREAKGRRAAAFLAVTLALGGVFMVLKAVEYAHHFELGQLPGRYYTYSQVRGPGDSLFFTLYFFMTGLHGLHVLVGMAVLAVLMVQCWRGAYSAEYHTPVELGGMYWHLVDLIWIFLYPLVYLVS